MVSLKEEKKDARGEAAPLGWGGGDGYWEAETIPFAQPPFTPDAWHLYTLKSTFSG